jgi:hypothetical protein
MLPDRLLGRLTVLILVERLPACRASRGQHLIVRLLGLMSQVLQQAVAKHIERASIAFEDDATAHTTLVATLSFLSAAPELPVEREAAGMAALKAMSGGLAPELLAGLAQQVEQAEDKLKAVALLLTAISE